jgi:hypothetical protein
VRRGQAAPRISVGPVEIHPANLILERPDLTPEQAHELFFAARARLETQGSSADADAVRALVNEMAPPRATRQPSRPGPPPMATGDQVEAMRELLAASRRPSGERSIARELGISRDAVRYALGKDRKRPRP